MQRQPTGRDIDVEAGRAAIALGPQLRAPPSDWRHAATLLLGRPLLLALFLGFGVSLLTSGRFTLRLIVDGALSFAFVPLCEFAGFVAVYRVTVTSPPLSQAVDRFFAGNTPWLWWLLSIMVAASLLPAERHGSLMAPILLSAPIPIALSLALDLRFFRDVMGRTTGRAVFDLARGVLDWLRTGDLDGTEICHPAIFEYEAARAALEQFARRTPAAAIGSSDFHGLGRLGLCRTFVFARGNKADDILEAVRVPSAPSCTDARARHTAMPS